MVQLREEYEFDMDEENDKRTPKFCINDHVDVLIEILKRLDGRSLGVAASVCQLWCNIARNDWLWEHLCFRHVSPHSEGVRTVVVALGGYRRLYMVCVRPLLSRLATMRQLMHGESDMACRVWGRHQVELSLSLFCVDYYERVLLGGSTGGRGAGGGRLAGNASASSLMFLCKAVNI